MRFSYASWCIEHRKTCHGEPRRTHHFARRKGARQEVFEADRAQRSGLGQPDTLGAKWLNVRECRGERGGSRNIHAAPRRASLMSAPIRGETTITSRPASLHRCPQI